MIFKNKIMGDGIAIIPSNDVLLSPCEGIIKQISTNKHIVVITSLEGYEILIHLGIDSLQMDSSKISVYFKEGDFVKVGDRILTFDLEELKKSAKSPITPVVFTNLKENQYIYYRFKKKLLRFKPINILICKK